MTVTTQMYQFKNMPSIIMSNDKSLRAWMGGVEQEIMDEIPSASKPKWQFGLVEGTMYLSISIEEGDGELLSSLLNNIYEAIEIT